jgi:hypothetical protein
MTASRDPDRLIRAFLGEGRTELPDASFDAVRAGIDRTRQRVVIGPWREPSMSTMFRLAGAAAVVAVVLAGIAIVIQQPTVGPSKSPRPSPTATAEPSAGPTLITYTWPGPLRAGDYSTSFSLDLDFEIAFTVPAGWESRDIEVIKGGAFVSFQLVANTFRDPCSNEQTTPVVGSTVGDLANALVADPALRTSAPKAVQLAGYSGVSFTYDPAEGVPCVGEDSRIWALPADRILPIGPVGPPTWPLRAGTHEVWILDVNDTRLVIDASAGPAASSALTAEVHSVLDSIRFGPLTHSVAIGSCTLSLSGQTSLAGQPLDVTLGPVVPAELRGPMPVPFPLSPPLAWISFTGEGWQSGQQKPGGFRLIPPPAAASTGFATSTNVGGYQGSWVFDSPGTWWVKQTGDLSGCVRQFPVLVHPAP